MQVKKWKQFIVECRRLTLILQNIDIFAKGLWLLCLVVVTTCPYIWPRSKCKIPSQWNHQNKAKLFLELQDGVSVDQNVDTKSLSQHQIFSTIMYQVSFKALRSNTETERFFQTLTQTICNICHVIVHFLPKKHCFWPKKALFFKFTKVLGFGKTPPHVGKNSQIISFFFWERT